MHKHSYSVIWGTATLMVTIVSCCSLVGLSIVPLISGSSYKTFNTLFTGLAVGSLTGSAIFSLIPQAFGLHTQLEKDYLWKSLVIFLGIYLFYCSERVMKIYFSKKAKKIVQEQRLRGEKSNVQKSGPSERIDESQAGDNVECQDNAVAMTEISLADGNKIHSGHHHAHHSALNSHDVISKALKNKSSEGNHNSSNNRRLDAIAPVAWMIIIGDGLHNLIDGLSIGAAFTDSLDLGFRTSLAVIFEELPHELGDFAVLIASGMSVRHAVLFNFLSACTCYIGMVAGLLLGDLTSSASFIFALAGGMFLYISLVDMMGELSATLEEADYSSREATHLLLMQNLGILSGIVIIFILSLFGNG